MPASSNQKLKLLYLYNMLEEETDDSHGLTMTQIIEKLAELGISAERKGIYRDLDVLREFGYTIETIQRKPVQYTLRRTGLTIEELSLLVDATRSSKFLTQQTSDYLVKKLSSLASTHERDALKGRVHVDGRIKSQRDSVFYNVDTIHEAMRKKRKVEFLYFKFDVHMQQSGQHGGVKYVHTPVSVVFSDGFYYLITWSDTHEDFVRFRIDRMRLVQVSNEKATQNEYISNYKFEDFAYQAFGMFDGSVVHAQLRTLPEGVDILVDRFGSDIRPQVLDDGSAEVSVSVRKSAQFFGWVAGMNGVISIVGPESLVAEYRAWLNKLASDS